VAKVFFVDVSAVNLVEVMKSIQACTIGPPRIKDVGLRAQVVVRDQAEADRVAGLRESIPGLISICHVC
jgi:hypothetical protein